MNINNQEKIKVIDFLNRKIIKADLLIDSINTILDSLDESNIKSIQIVKGLLADGRQGDSLFLFLNDIFKTVAYVTKATNQKLIVDSIANNILKSIDENKNWQQELFSQATPLSAKLILLSLKKEIFAIGIESLKGI